MQVSRIMSGLTTGPATFGRSILRFCYRLIKPLFGTVVWRAAKYKIVRRLVFETAPPKSLLLSSAAGESFVVSSDDKAIGRDVYITGSFDFEKLKSAVQIIGTDWNGELLIDIGSNIGVICIPAVKRGLFRRAVAVEPEPFNYRLLCTNIELNDLGEEIKTHNIALGQSQDRNMILELSDRNFGDHRIRTTDSIGLAKEESRQTIHIECGVFDDVIGETDPRATLIWIDTQGYEGYVLSGARKALMRHTPLVLEFWPYALKRNGCYGLLKEALLEAGYRRFYNLSHNSPAVSLTGAALDKLLSELDDGMHGSTDILVC